MKILVATTKTQGQRPNDFCFCEGEPVTFGTVCDTDHGDPDGSCGCARSFAGLDSHMGTTTAVVSKSDWTLDEYAEKIYAYARRLGLPAHQDIRDSARSDAMRLLGICHRFKVGAIVEQRKNIQKR